METQVLQSNVLSEGGLSLSEGLAGEGGNATLYEASRKETTAWVEPPREGQHWFQTIPPERRGLDGKYDHCGLAKRVRQRLQGHTDLECLNVRQRGRVVLLSGCVASADVLHCLVKLALGVEGADAVETRGMSIAAVPD